MPIGEVRGVRNRMEGSGGKRALAGLLVILLVILAAASGGAEDPTRGRGDPAARLAAAPSASEHWDLVAAFESGHFFFARFLVTNEGPGERTAVGSGHLLLPQGQVVSFEYGRRHGVWRLSPDRLRIDVASSVLDLRPPVRRVGVDSDSRGIKVDLQFRLAGTPATSDAGSEAKRWADVVQMPSPVEGTIWVTGMPEPLAVRGSITATHAWTNHSEVDQILRQVQFFARQGDVGFYVADITGPSGIQKSWLAAARGGKIVCQTSDSKVLLGEPFGSLGSVDYPLPSKLEVGAGGIRATIRVRRELLRINPMKVVPQPFRFLLSFRMAPRQIWAEAEFDLECLPPGENAPLAIHGNGVMAVDFLNALKR